MKKAGEPKFITYIQAIDSYCNQIEYAIKIVDLIKGSKNVPLIENRLGKLNKELTNFNIFLSDDYEKFFRRTFIDFDSTKLNEIKKEITRTLNELKRKFIGKIYKESLIIFESICLKIETAIETDLEFIKGDVKLKFIATGFDLLFTVQKNGLIRTYQISEYFEFEIKNWLDCIDETDNVSEKIQAANNAILVTANKFSGFKHQKVKELKNEAIEHFKTVLNYIENSYQTRIPPQQTKAKTDKLKAPVLGLFCRLINKIGIDKKDEIESAAVYCKRICGKFKLPYTDRVRQNYNVNEGKKLIQELTEKVLPLIDNETKNLVEKYLDSKQPLKQNLYA